MDALKIAMLERKRQDPEFTGTIYAAISRMNSVQHQQFVNLLSGKTPPWKVTAHTLFELLKVFKPYGLMASDFMKPDPEEDVCEG
jgi:predicted P-loop ATPase/GTPase